jgi:glycosyltransferase involved in cell wall biosynthesis
MVDRSLRTFRPELGAVAVIVPAHDEQHLLEGCLDALAAAAWHARRGGLRVSTLVVADACTDATRATARAHGAFSITTTVKNVGAARAAGTERALEILARDEYLTPNVYLLHTDADSVVPPDWIIRHLRLAVDHDAVLGPVEVGDWAPRGLTCARRFEEASAAEPDGHRVHGANLGVRADAYLRVGGFRALPVAEDRALVAALRAARESVVFRRDLVVSTSARVSRRVRGGFSDYLTRLGAGQPQPPSSSTTDSYSASSTSTSSDGRSSAPSERRSTALPSGRTKIAESL